MYPLAIPTVVPIMVAITDVIMPMARAIGKPNNRPFARSLPIESVPINPNWVPPNTNFTLPTVSISS